MQIGKNWNIESDGTNVIVMRRQVSGKESKVPGLVRWSNEAYFATMQGALNWLIQNEIKGGGLKDFETICQKIDKVEALIASALKISPPRGQGGAKTKGVV